MASPQKYVPTFSSDSAYAMRYLPVAACSIQPYRPTTNSPRATSTSFRKPQTSPIPGAAHFRSLLDSAGNCSIDVLPGPIYTLLFVTFSICSKNLLECIPAMENFQNLFVACDDAFSKCIYCRLVLCSILVILPIGRKHVYHHIAL